MVTMAHRMKPTANTPMTRPRYSARVALARIGAGQKPAQHDQGDQPAEIEDGRTGDHAGIVRRFGDVGLPARLERD